MTRRDRPTARARSIRRRLLWVDESSSRWARSRLRRQCGVELPPCACRGELCGTDVYIIGTAHISPQSARDVEEPLISSSVYEETWLLTAPFRRQELIAKVKPDTVVVELSRDRIGSLYPSGATESRTTSEFVRTRSGTYRF